MPKIESPRPNFSDKDVKKFVKEVYDINVTVKSLESYLDQNFHLTDENGREYVFKISNSAEKQPVLEAQNQALEDLAKQQKTFHYPHVCRTVTGEQIALISNKSNVSHIVRMLTFLKGNFLADVNPHTPEMFTGFGHFLGSMDKALQGFYHPAVNRDLGWDLKNALHANQNLHLIANPHHRTIVEYFLHQFEMRVLPVLPRLRSSVIHNDANDHNVLVDDSNLGSPNIIGIIDFGDLVYTHTVCELAIAISYIMFDKKDPVKAAKYVVRGYHEILPLTELELEVLFYLACARLCISVIMSAYQKKVEPKNEYISISEKSAWTLLKTLLDLNPQRVINDFRQVCNMPSASKQHVMSRQDILNLRKRHIGKSLSISYKQPLKIIGGAMQYLYDDSGRTYLDAVNNVPHVGHCHPRVVKAAQRQMAILNTNTRYLHENLVQYAQRLTSLLPEPLSVCFLVNSGSEANDLALRLARTHTKSKDIIVIDGAYHGTTISAIDTSPYKFDGPGGTGPEPYVHKVVTPDIFRGIYRTNDPDAGKKYANHVMAAIEEIQNDQKQVAAFICESLMGVAGQIVFPDGYLQEAFQHVRNNGGVCIADEVQVGFGRVGSHFWGFETQGVVPDIVTLGKPIGNGHPLAAVATTPEIANSFDNGMEYFNTYGGNPVSCAVGIAVLDVIKDEKLQDNARKVGGRMKKNLEALKAKHPIIGDVRGLGLFIGIELVLDRESLAPAAKQTSYIVEKMKDKGILISRDGPLYNVLKIKPPMVFTEANADFLVSTLDEILREDE